MDELHVPGRELGLREGRDRDARVRDELELAARHAETVNWSAESTVSTSVAARSPAPSTTVWPSLRVSVFCVMIGASSTFVNVIVAASGPVVSAPSKTETL